MEKLKYRTQEGEKILNNPTKEDLKGYNIIVAVVKKAESKQEEKPQTSAPITEKELVAKIKNTKNKKNK